MTRNRKGFTLVEMLVVTVLGALVLAAALQVLITNQRTYSAQSATIAGQQSTRIALELLGKSRPGSSRPASAEWLASTPVSSTATRTFAPVIVAVPKALHDAEHLQR